MSFLRRSAFWLLLLVSQVTLAQPPSLTYKQLFEQGHFEQLVELGGKTADALFYRGLALARLNRPDDARQLFGEAQQRYPADKRFPIELAGLAFQGKNSSEAIKHLRRALRIDAKDEYANDLLASIYLLNGNLDAAVKYWNRVRKPQLNRILFEPEPRTDSVLLNRIFAVTPASLLRLDDLQTTEARLSSLEVFSSSKFTLTPKSDGNFDLVFRNIEKNGFGDSRLQALIRLLRGLPYQTIYPEYFNISGSTTHITSLVRWDSNKRRASLTFSAPLPNRPSFRFRITGDVRDENWVLSPETNSAFAFKSRQFSLDATLDQVVSGKWKWGIGTALVHENASQLSPDDVFTEGYSLQYSARIERQLLNIPERRLSITARLGQSFGRNFAPESSSFAKTQAVTELNWLPGAKLGDYEVVARLSGGRSWGTVPFSDLFILGVERDNNLLLRGHVGTRGGKKGSAPLAQAYLLSNLEFTRRLFNNGLVDLKLGPFLDIAKPYRTLQAGASGAWLYDPGIALKIRVLGAATVTFAYGRNLHEDRNAFYVSALQ